MKTICCSFLLLVALAVTACGPAPRRLPLDGSGNVVGSAAPAVKAVPDSSMGLSRTSVFDDPAPPDHPYIVSEPGEMPRVARAHPEAPPPIPHGIADFEPITRTDNSCVDCHAVEEKAEGEPTPIPKSHYTDYRNAPEAPGEKVAGARWVCTSCHVPLTDAKPLVGNSG